MPYSTLYTVYCDEVHPDNYVGSTENRSFALSIARNTCAVWRTTMLITAQIITAERLGQEHTVEIFANHLDEDEDDYPGLCIN